MLYINIMMNDSINDYKILDVLGEGAFGKVYKALGVDRKYYALKIIPITPKMKDKIREEGRLLTSMEHPNILWARQFFYYQQQKYFVIITEYCNKGGLDNYIGSLSSEQQISIMKGVAEGLLYLHRERAIIHRDLKPQNILLCDWLPKIADMGVAKMLKTYQVSTKIGTPLYMAREMLEGDYSIEVDIWALGIIFMEVTLGKRIFELLKGEEIPSKRQTFPSEQLLNQIQSSKMRKLIKEMLQKNPKDRITIEEVLEYFDSSQLQVSKGNRTTFAQQKKKKQSYTDSINDCYIKTEEYWFNKYQVNFIKQLYEKNMVEIVAEAEQGNKKAQFVLAKMYEYGYGMVKNTQKSEQLLLKCYEQEQPHCCYELYLRSTSSIQKFQYLMMGKQLEEVRCLCKLAENYIEGNQNLPVDYQQAQEIIEGLCSKNYPPAFLLKGTLFSKKNSEYYNLQQMRECYKKGSDLGNVGCKIMFANQLYKQKKYSQSLELSKIIENESVLELKDKLNLSELEAKCFSKLKDSQKTVEKYYKCMELDDGTIEKDYLGTIATYLESIQMHSKAIDYYNQAINRIKPKYKNSNYYTERLKFLCETLYALYYERKMYKDAYGIAKLSAQLNFESGKADQAYMIYGGVGVQKNEALGFEMLKKYEKERNSEAISYLSDISKERRQTIT